MRCHLTSWLSQQELSVAEVWAWYQLQKDLVEREAQGVLAEFDAGISPNNSRYLFQDRVALVDLFNAQQTELGNATMLLLLAATEAALRIDFVNRVADKKRDAISRAFTALYKEHKLRVGLEEQILEVYKQHATPDVQRRIGDFIGTLKLRHWLAHGRYWRPKFGRAYDPDLVFEICRELIEALGLG